MGNQGNNPIQVGLFVALGLVALMGSILLLGGDKAIFKSYATLYSKMTQVQGLNPGSVVSLAGITIGNVSEMKFAPGENALIVTMRVEASFLNRIPADSLVEVRTQGALGDKFIYIIPGSLSGEMVKDQGSLQPNLATDLMGVLSERGGEAGRVFDIINEVQKMLVSINGEGRLEKVMTNMSEASAEIKSLTYETRRMMTDFRGDNPENIKKTIASLNSILGKIDKGQGTLGALINDPSMHQQLKALIGETPRRKYIQSVVRDTLERSENTGGK